MINRSIARACPWALTALAALMLCGSIASAPTLQASVLNNLSTDTVDIQLATTEVPHRLIIDDECINQDYRLINKGMKCWIRAKATLSSTGNSCVIPPSQWASNGWIACSDGYAYYRVPLNESESISMRIAAFDPWSGNGTSRKLSSNLAVEAIQADNFYPNFSSEKPWGDLIPETCAHAREEVAS